MKHPLKKHPHKSAARFFAVQALFQMEATEQNLSEIRAQFKSHRFGEILEEGEMPEADSDLFDQILNDAIEWQAKIDQRLNEVLDKRWSISKIDPVLRAIFRAAGSEVLTEKTDFKVIATQYVEITRAFFGDEKKVKFANAILDKFNPSYINT